MNLVAMTNLTKPYLQTNIDNAVRLVMDQSGMLQRLTSLSKGSIILVKPNVVADLPSELGATTDPRVALAVCRSLAEIGLQPIVAESSSIGVNTETALDLEYGLVKEAGFDVVPLDDTPTFYSNGLEIYNIVNDCSVILTLPKLKTHDQTGVSLGMKNLKGLISDKSKLSVHLSGLNTGIVRILETLKVMDKPVYSVLDGLVGMEGIGPVYGSPVDVGIIAAGCNPVAADAFYCWLMGYDVNDIEHITMACDEGLGPMTFCLGSETGDIKRHNFVKADDVLKTLAVDGITFYWPCACTGCKNTIMSVLHERQYWGRKMPKISFAAGRNSELPPSGKVVLVGNCAIQSLAPCTFKIRQSEIVSVKGCPPTNESLDGAIGD